MPMLRSKPTSAASSERTTVRESGDLLLVESPTAEEALDRLSSLLGPDVEIVAAGKVARGGVGGFFAREMVQLSARAPSRPAPPAPAAAAAPAGEIPAHLRTLLSERMAEPAAPAWLSPPEPSFGETLRRQLGTEPPPPPSPTAAAESWVPEASPLPAAGLPFSVPPSLPSRLDVLDASWGFAVEDDAQANVGPAAPDPAGAPAGFAPVDPAAATPTVEPTVVLAPLSDTPPPEPVPAPDLFNPFPALGSSRPGDAPGTGGVAWSPDELVRIGLPFSFVRPLLDTDPQDDLAWIRGIATSLNALCRPLPTGDFALAGARAGHLAQPLRLEVLRRPERGPKRGSICCSMVDDAESRRWFERVRRDRWTHLVVGPLDGKAFLDLHPKAVSWVGADALPGALRLAAELGVPLGYFKSHEAGPALSATPIEVALAVRALVVRR